MLPRLAAVGLGLHGLIHLIGFVVPWRLAAVDGFAYRTTALNGALVVGDAGARLIGLAWLALAVGFVIAALGLARGARWATPATAGLAVLSLAVCALGLPESAAGLVIDGVILAALAFVAVSGRARPGTVR